MQYSSLKVLCVMWKKISKQMSITQLAAQQQWNQPISVMHLYDWSCPLESFCSGWKFIHDTQGWQRLVIADDIITQTFCHAWCIQSTVALSLLSSFSLLSFTELDTGHFFSLNYHCCSLSAKQSPVTINQSAHFCFSPFCLSSSQPSGVQQSLQKSVF